MAANRGKDMQDEPQTSLIPAIESQEQRLRTELEEVRRQTENHILQAQERAQQRLKEGRHSVSELVEQRRKDGLAELQKQAEQICRSAEEFRTNLKQQAEKNMARAVKRVVDVVTAVGDTT